MRPLFGQAVLDVGRITTADGELMLKLMEYEQVHPYENIRDVERRLDYGFRCFGLFHPKLLGEPLVFIHVALLREIAPSMEYVRQNTLKEHEANTAVFYSISASEQGKEFCRRSVSVWFLKN